MANGLKVYKIEDSQTGKVYEIEGPEGATDEELYSFLENDLGSAQPSPQPKAPAAPVAGPVPVSNSPAPQQELVPNAMLGANARTGEATRTLKDFPEAKSFLQDQFYNRKQFGEVQGEFNKRYGALGVTLPDNMASVWAENQALFDTPAGRQYLQNNDPIAPVQKATGVEDPLAPDSVVEEFGVAAKKAVYDTANTYRAAAAIGADLLGAKETAKHWLDDYLEQSAANDLENPTNTGSYKDVNSVGDAAMYSANILGSLVPDVLSSLGIGVVGGMIGKQAVKQVADGIVERELAAGATEEMAKQAAAAVVQKATVRGGVAGAVGQSVVQESGSTVGDTYAKTGKVRAGASLLAGIASGGLEAIFPARILSRIGGPVGAEALTDSLVKKIGKDAAEGVLIEGIPEALQSIITQLPAGQPIDFDEVVESFIRGGIGGSVLNTTVAGYEAARQQKANPAAPAPTPTGVPEGSSPIAVPEATNRRTKAYRTQIQETNGQVDTRVRSLTSHWQNPPEIEVHQNFNALPGVANNAVGVYADGKLQINTEVLIKQAEDSGRTVDQMLSALTFHEGLGHHGLALEFGQALDDKLSTILENSTVYQAKVRKWMKENPDAYAGDRNRDIRALEEVLAERSEKVETKSLPAGYVNVMKNTVKDFGRRMGLDLEYSTREVETILGMAHSAVVNGKGRDVRSNGYRYMMSGRNAANVDVNRLEFAENLINSGIDEEQVRKATGWHKGPDGLMRFELDDSNAKLTFQMRELNSGGTRSLDQVLDHKPVFEAYPELAEITVTRRQMEKEQPKKTKNFRGFYDPETQTIYISSDESDRNALSIILHEVQHVVQDQEGFSSGGNPDEVMGVVPDDIMLKGARQFMKWTKSQKPKSYGEANAKKAALARLKTLIEDNDIEGLRDFMSIKHEFTHGARVEAYNHLLGEVEARDTQNRQSLTAEQRREIRPLESTINDEGLDPDSLIMYNDVDDDKTPKIVNKYMMFNPKKGAVTMTPEEIQEMSPDELFEAENALQILRGMTEGYEPTVMSYDDLEWEANARNLSPARLLKGGISPGELTRRLFMYDIAMDKMNIKLANIWEKTQNGMSTATERATYLTTLAKRDDLARVILDEQGELGRALNGTKRVKYTRKNIEGTIALLAQFEKGSMYESLQNDPEAFYKYAQGIQAQIEESAKKAKNHGATFFGNALNLPHALMSTADFSAPLRQGLFLISYPAWWKAFGNMFRYAGDKSAFNDMMEGIEASNMYPLMLEANLALTNLSDKLTQREEAFQNTWLEHVPLFKHIYKGSERAYTGFLNKLRADVFTDLVAQLEDGYTIDDVKAIARFVNAASGRGNLPDGSGLLPDMRGAAPMLNGALFSPRLISSRLQMMDPRNYVQKNKVARKAFIRSMVSTGGAVILILTLAAMAGAEVEKDPRSSDFAKIKIGNTRLDIGGGQSQYITLAARLAKNSTKTTDGDIREYGVGFKPESRGTALGRFARNKLSPVASLAADWLTGVDAVGKKFEWDKALVSRFLPMVTSDIKEAYKEQGAATTAAMAGGALLGVGVSTYTSNSLDTESDLEPPFKFDMKAAKDGEYGNVVVENGVVRLDDNAQLEWKNRLNAYYKQWLAEEVAKPEWKTMTAQEKREVIADVRKDARKETKLDMLELLQIEEEAE